MRNNHLMTAFVAFLTLMVCSSGRAQTATTDHPQEQIIQGQLFGEPEYFLRKHVIDSPKPEYPEAAKQGGIQGEVIMFVWFDKFGELIETKPLMSPHESLSEAAVTAVKKWRIKPHTKGVDAADLVSEVRFIFSLSSEPKVSEAPADEQRTVSEPLKREMERRRKQP